MLEIFMSEGYLYRSVVDIIGYRPNLSSLLDRFWKSRKWLFPTKFASRDDSDVQRPPPIIFGWVEGETKSFGVYTSQLQLFFTFDHWVGTSYRSRVK